MKKRYAIMGLWLKEDVTFLSGHGIILEENSTKTLVIEDGELYKILHDHFFGSKWYREYFDFVYSEDEILSSDYCVMSVLSRRGYPQPEESREAWYSKAYDMSEICMECGRERRQIGEFWINKVPKKPLWGFTSWNFDSVFLTKELYESEFKPLGIGAFNVRDKKGRLLPDVLQLDIPITNENLDLSMQHDIEICPKCGRTKYRRLFQFPFFPAHEYPLPHIFYTKEYFGTGGEAFRLIIVSKELAKRLLELKLLNRWCLIPCKKDLANYLKSIEY